MPGRHVVLTSIGTDGDVFPFVALGVRLRERGYRVTLCTIATYAELATQRGLEFAPLVSAAEAEEWFSHPDCWHPLKCALVGARWGTKYIARQYEILAQLTAAGDAILVSNPGVLAARMMHDRFGTPLATVILQPWVVQSNIEPPLLPGLSLPRGLPDFIGNLYWSIVDRIGDRLIGQEVNAVRQQAGLPRVRKLFRWWLSPQCILGLFPAWYGPPQRDWPPQVRLTGFPLDDGRPDRELPATVSQFLQAGEPPVAFTFGTGMQHAAKVFAACVEACRLAGVRGLFLTKYAEQMPQPLPKFACHADFAPFRTLFPLCAAVTHHGGIGTTSQALAAGVPQLILPFAFDQPDNALRLQRIGVGESLSRRRRSAADIAAALRRLLSPAVGERCRISAARIETNGLSAAADHLEALFAR